MIAVRLEGRLGNQLFQYAFIFSAAKKLKRSFYLDKSVDFILIERYFNIEPDFCHFPDRRIFSIKGYKNLFSHYLRRFYYRLLPYILFLKPVAFADDEQPAEQLVKIRNRRIFSGFFQSEEYFRGYEDAIRGLFSIKSPYKNQFEEIRATLPTGVKLVAVHVRRGDYLTLGLSLQEDYFHKAIAQIHEEDNFYVIVSDDPEFAASTFSYLPHKYISKHTEIIDFQFLSHADICILSNSSFSWWAAWLNENKNKKVIAPALWLGKDEGITYPAGVLQSEWTLI